MFELSFSTGSAARRVSGSVRTDQSAPPAPASVGAAPMGAVADPVQAPTPPFLPLVTPFPRTG